MTIDKPALTVEQFDAFALLPENSEKLFEYIAGEIVEVPSNPYVSAIAYNIGFAIKLHLRDHQIKGHVTGEAGGYMVAGERYAPDVAFISIEKQPELAHEGYNPNPPDLAVDVVSSNRPDELSNLRIKVSNYNAVGTVVWVVESEKKQIEVYVPGQAVQILRQTDTLDGGDVLPGLSFNVATIFEP